MGSVDKGIGTCEGALLNPSHHETPFCIGYFTKTFLPLIMKSPF